MFDVTCLDFQTIVLAQTIAGLFGKCELQTKVLSNQHQFFDRFWHRVPECLVS